MDYIIETYELSKSFKNVKVLDNINIGIQSGSVFGFLGPNGAGKTTTVRILGGVLSPSSGIAKLFGRNVREHSDFIRTKCGVQTDTNLYNRLTVYENLEIWGKLFGLKHPSLNNRVNELIDMFGLGHRKDNAAGTLSKGMGQKLAIARALIHEPEVLFLDEPTAGLDPEASEDVTEYIKKYVEKKKHTVFLCSHRLEELELLCDSVAIIVEGRILAQGAVDELSGKLWKENSFIIRLANPDKGFASRLLDCDYVESAVIEGCELMLSVTEKTRIPKVVKILVEMNAEIMSVTEEKHTLRDIYFATVPQGGDSYESV
jgi:ABC-2 type transport system ATP-binding protein